MNESLAKMFIFYGDEAKKSEDANQVEEFFKKVVEFAQQFEVCNDE